MIKYLLFSDKLRQNGLFVKLTFIKMVRLLTILFKRNKDLETISFDYYKNWYFDNAYLFVNFEFKNAVWFKIEHFKSFDFSKPIVLDIENVQADTINFEVFGFFQRQIFEINLNKEAQINRRLFSAKLENIKTIKLSEQKSRVCIPKIVMHFSAKLENIKTIKLSEQKSRVCIPKIVMHSSNPNFVSEKISVKSHNIQLSNNIQLDYKPFNIQDYI